MLDSLLVPIQADGGVAMQIAAKAGGNALNCLYPAFVKVLTD